VSRALAVGAIVLALVVAAVAIAYGPGRADSAPAGTDREARLAHQLGKERARWAAERAHLRRRLAMRLRASTVRAAAELAHVVYGVPVRGLLALGWCESRHSPAAYNATALGGSHASGWTQILFPSTWSTTPYRHLSPFDPATSALAAGFIWRRNDGRRRPGFGEWRDVCTLAGDRA
jgi:hypothetical protein